MDPAESNTLQQELSTRAARVNQHEMSLLQMMEHLQRLTASLTQLNEQMSILKTQLTSFVMSLLSGRAAAWSLAISTQQPGFMNNYTHFTAEMKVFDHPLKGRQAKSQLLDLQQGNCSVSEYAINFLILGVENGWDDSARQAIFLKGLSGQLKDELALREECSSLNSMIDLAIRINNMIRERDRERKQRRTPAGAHSCPTVPDHQLQNNNHYVPEPPSSPIDEPMQLGRA